MEERDFSRIEPDMDVCDINGDKLGTVARMYRHNPAVVGPVASTISQLREEVVEVKSGFLGLGTHYYIPVSAIHDVTDGGVFVDRPRDEIEPDRLADQADVPRGDDLSDRDLRRSATDSMRVGAVPPRPTTLIDAEARVVIVANRGPNDFVWEDGSWVTRTASGGLVSMLTPLARRAGRRLVLLCLRAARRAAGARRACSRRRPIRPIPACTSSPCRFPADVYHAYYGQISNEVLWMLQHHVIGTGGYDHLDARRHRAWAAATSRPTAAGGGRRRVRVRRRERFLVQDYHLYPLPGAAARVLPRHADPALHPHPVSGAVRPAAPTAAWRETILRGLLGADVVGLQTPSRRARVPRLLRGVPGRRSSTCPSRR